MATKKAIIIGAGPTGLATALRLHQTTNIQCTVYELRSEPTTLGGAIGIPSNGLRLFHRLGVYDALVARGSTDSTLRIYSTNGDLLSQQDPVAYARAQTGFGHMRIKRTDLVNVLLEEVHKTEKIQVHFNKQITSIFEDDSKGKVTATFADRTTDTADLLIGCDGIHSAVRKLYVDPVQEPEYTGFAGLLSIIPLSSIPPQITKDHFSNGTFGVVITEEGAIFATSCTASGDEIFWAFSKEVPLPNSDSDGLDSREGWQVTRRTEVESFKSTMQSILSKVHGKWGDTLRHLVDSTTVVNFYPVYRLPLGGKWSKGCVILLGDAAHAMQPHGGQGVSMAMEDVFLLSKLLAKQDVIAINNTSTPRSQPLEPTFQTFDRIRRPRVTEIYNISAGNVKIRRKTGPWGLWIKELMMRGYFFGAWALGLEKWGFGQGHLVYDVEGEIE